MNNIIKIVITSIVVICICLIFGESSLIDNNMNKNFMIEGLKSIKTTEEKINIKLDEIDINARIPIINHKNKEVEKYLNSTIKKDINEFIDLQIQNTRLDKKRKVYLNINYHITFEDRDALNLIIFKKLETGKKEYTLYKSSYVFDLNTAQVVHIDEFFKDNKDYDKVIKKYILDYISKNNLPYDKNRITINSDTEYYLLDHGIGVYFNPYQDTYENLDYQFKIPYDIFKNKIKKIQTKKISAQVSTDTKKVEKPYLKSVLNIPVITIDDKKIEQRVNSKIEKEIIKFYNKVKKEAEDYNKDFENETPFIANVSYDIKKNSDNIISIFIEYYQYSGGAHEYYEDVAYNIDLTTGNFINLEQLFKKEINYKKIINENIINQIDIYIKDSDENSYLYEFKGIKDNQKFYLRENKIVIFFDLYEIAPYAAGIPKFEIDIESVKDFISKDYIERI